ncbi:hypothetical protein MMC21_004122 [Puttea exsequens]|nr:hypothetical protein [Puttea exsequens]
MPPVQRFQRNKSWHSLYVGIIVLLAINPTATALYVVPGSNCTPACSSALTAYTTNGTNIACHDGDYNGTLVGEAFQDCVSCELSSQTLDSWTAQTDLGWALFNMRYALDWCLFGYPGATNRSVFNQCTSTCSKISKALQINILTPHASTTYDYCQDPAFLPNVDKCASCYKVIPNQLLLSNFLRVLAFGCQSQPKGTIPFPVKSSDVFTDHPPSNYSDLNSAPTQTYGLSPKARVAIAIIVPVIAFLLISMIFLLCYVSRHDPFFDNSQNGQNNKDIDNPTSPALVSKPAHDWKQTATMPLQTYQSSRRDSTNSRRVYPAPPIPERVAIPAPLRPQKSKSPIPYSRLNNQPEAIRSRTSSARFSDTFDKSPKRTPTRTPRRASEESIPPLPATRYVPPIATKYNPSPVLSVPAGLSLETRPKRARGSPAGLLSWERIALQNARIRALQDRSPSPVSPLTEVHIVPIPKSPSILRGEASYPPVRVATPRQATEIPRRRATPLAEEVLGEELVLPLSPLRFDFRRTDTPNPDDGKLVRSSSGNSGVMRTGSGRSQRSRKEVRWSKDVDYEASRPR